MQTNDLIPKVDVESMKEKLLGVGTRLRNPRIHLKEDLNHLFSGVLDWRGFLSGYTLVRNPVEVVVRDKDGRIKAIRRSHNLRTTMGRDQLQRLQMFGNISANATYATVRGAATSTTATTLTNTGAAFPTTGGPNTGLQGQIVVAMSSGSACAYGVIMSNTATALTVDQWYDPTSATGAAATTPTGTCPYVILPTAGQAIWIGLSTNSAAAAAGDVLRTADGLFADGTTSAAATEQTTNGLSRVFVQPTFPGAGQIQLQNTWTYTGASSVTIAKVVLCNSKAAAGSLLLLETLLSATATVAANGDTIQVTWTINL